MNGWFRTFVLFRNFVSKIMNQKGFTFIELLVVIGIVAVVSVAGITRLGGFNSAKNLELTMNEMVSTVRDAQRRSITQENGTGWGVRFTNPVSGADQYEVFSGASYSSSGVVSFHSLRRSVVFSEPTSGNFIDVVFEPVTGKVSGNTTISLMSENLSSATADIIINTAGLITGRIN